jgi:tetraacyldisaccharide 4'-kinase
MRAPEFWRRGGLRPLLLSPASAIWRRRAAARFHNASPSKVDAPVICIGNAVAGGAGKTPVALAVNESLMRHGIAAHFLSRGYGGREPGPLRVNPDLHSAADVGDEPLLLAQHAPTWIAHDRVAGAQAAVAAGAGAIVMDDGFQNPSLFKDISILVVDGGYGFGNGYVMPAGPLREDLGAAVDRADAIAIIGTDDASIEKHLGGRRPVIAARFVPVIEDDDLSGQPVVAFAGIGRPEKFFETLSGMGCTLVATRSFADHHAYSADEVMRLIDTASAAGAIAVTTEKDATRLPLEARDMVRTLRVTLEWRDRDALDTVLAPALQARA